ncbi:MAG: phosphatidylserine decarboxylase [Gammaproteobacteria bacterium]|jgi:phosphatidylserine decarboxylase
MPTNRYPFIAKEGWLLLLILAGLVLLAFYFFSNSITISLAVTFCFFLFLLRDPQRNIPSSPLALLSPVHGKVIQIDETDDPWLSLQGIERRAKRVRIKMSSFDIYSLRSPAEGKVMEQWSKKCQEEKGQRKFSFWIRTDEGDDVVVVFRLGSFVARLFRIYIQSGERLGQGQRCGYLFFGGTVDVFISTNAKLEIEIGQSITSGEDILAHLIHEKPASMINDNNPHGKAVVSGGAA